MTPNLKIPRRPNSVIFADDDEDTLLMLRNLGQKQGWNVDTAATAEELLAKVKARCGSSRTCFDIVVTDVSFFNQGGQPAMSGISAATQIERAVPNLPILFLTGYGGLLTRENVRAIPTAEVLEKGVDPNDLIERIEYLIEFTRSRYEGPERRRTSVNRTNSHRRSTDNPMGVPKVLRLVMGAEL